jgi:hypothetical protein
MERVAEAIVRKFLRQKGKELRYKAEVSVEISMLIFHLYNSFSRIVNFFQIASIPAHTFSQ